MKAVLTYLLVILLVSAHAAPGRALEARASEAALAAACAEKAAGVADAGALEPAKLAPCTSKSLRGGACESMRSSAAQDPETGWGDPCRYARPQSDAELERTDLAELFHPPRG